ncbi:hypothetical protein [Picosynechococcus sp. NKBG042902]|uniref:hypothetical protein n=1 Tax=Picosynechococcus sp. NKBG042902 TaxID=490193 RepID=UPI000A75EA92|nr:hypothetical protein [Picosynechococcus sp. NKBG042902]
MAYQGLWEMFKRIILLVVLALGLWSCGDRLDARLASDLNREPTPVTTQALTEVATPSLITELRQELDQYQPQVKILSPRPDETFNSTTIDVQLQVNDLPIFKDEELGMGPHIHLFVDDQPYIAVYDTSKPVTLENLSPGSHLIRAFASRPWHESFKNEGAYAETTFNIFTKSNNNIPDFQQPLLTYSRPQGTYGAEPIMLDFYLTNAPLHFIAQADNSDDVNDWRIRITINGESFILDDWHPIYLEGFKKGENWLKLEFIDDQGELLENTYNSPVRVINYDPKLNDTLAKLVQNKLSLRTAKRLVTTKPLAPEVETAAPEETLEPAPTVVPEVDEATPPAETEMTPAPEETLPTLEEEVAPEAESSPSPDLPEAMPTEEEPAATVEEASPNQSESSLEVKQPDLPPEIDEEVAPTTNTPEVEDPQPTAPESEVEPETSSPPATAESAPEPEVEPRPTVPESDISPETDPLEQGTDDLESPKIQLFPE